MIFRLVAIFSEQQLLTSRLRSTVRIHTHISVSSSATSTAANTNISPTINLTTMQTKCASQIKCYFAAAFSSTASQCGETCVCIFWIENQIDNLITLCDNDYYSNNSNSSTKEAAFEFDEWTVAPANAHKNSIIIIYMDWLRNLMRQLIKCSPKLEVICDAPSIYYSIYAWNIHSLK